jgi:hypothetical protein
VGTLVDFRGWLRLDLNDPAGSSQRFADGDLDRAVARAVAEYSLAFPRETDTEHTCSASRIQTLPGGTYPGLIGVAEVEQPYGAGGEYPPRLIPFKLAAGNGSLRLLGRDVPAAGDVIRIRWLRAHVVDAGSSTVGVEYDPLLSLGAAGYACLSYSSPAADNFRYEDGAAVAQVDDSMVPREWRARGALYLGQFRAELGRLRSLRARTGRPWISWGREPAAPRWPGTHSEGLREP